MPDSYKPERCIWIETLAKQVSQCEGKESGCLLLDAALAEGKLSYSFFAFVLPHSSLISLSSTFWNKAEVDVCLPSGLLGCGRSLLEGKVLLV